MTPADTLLVLRAQQGDRAALDAALQSIQRPLFGYIARLVTRSGVAAEDVLQETLLRIVGVPHRQPRGVPRARPQPLGAADRGARRAAALRSSGGRRRPGSIVVLGLFALGAYITRAVLRVLQAIDAR